ncbi:unnamed protein product, partial [Hymenolepis diminuta]
SQYTWLDICFTAAFAKTNAKAIFTDSQLLHIKKKIPKFDDLLKRVPADKWNANNKIAVETANMLLVMPDYDARILNEVLNSVSSETPDEELKKMLAKRGSELQGAFLLNLLLDGEIQLFENEETPEEINSPISTTESDEEPEQTVEDTMKFMLSPKWKDASPEEYYKALKNRQNWKEAFASLTYEEMAAVLTRVEEADDFLSQMPEDVIKRCVENLPKVKNVEGFELYNTFDYEHYPKTLRKLYGDSTTTTSTTTTTPTSTTTRRTTTTTPTTTRRTTTTTPTTTRRTTTTTPILT